MCNVIACWLSENIFWENVSFILLLSVIHSYSNLKKIGKTNLGILPFQLQSSTIHIKRYRMFVNKSIYQLFWTRGLCLTANAVHNINDVIFHPVFCTKYNKGVLLYWQNQNQTFCPNVIFNITSNDIVEKNKKNREVARREPYYDKKRNISVNIFDTI